MVSLKTKMLSIVTLVVLAIVSLSAVISLNQQKKMIKDIAEQNTVLLSETIKGSITDAMIAGQSDETRRIFSHIASQKLIKTLRIIDESGKVLNSANPSEIGTTAFSSALLAYRNGSQSNGDLTGEHSYTRLSPISNSPVCHHCHEASRSVLGLLEIEPSLDYVQAYLASIKRQTLFSAAVMTLLLVFFICLSLIVYLDRPIRTLISSMEEVEKGQFAATPAITSSTEMNLLSSHFNRMLERLQELIGSTVANERALARAQEKLSNHLEISRMNVQLEQQLREIKQLNISLEERIEEIEEGNYKIADLAGELEDKNETLERAVSRLSTLHSVGLGITSTMDVEALFQLIVKSTSEALLAQVSYIALKNSREGDTFSISSIHGHGNPACTPAKPRGERCSVSSWVTKNRRSILITDIDDFPHFADLPPLGFELRNLISVPLIAKEEVIGTINVANRLGNSPFTSEDMELLMTIAGQASVAIRNASLYDELQKSYLSTIQSLVSAIEASDSYTRGHSERVTCYSLLIARKIELPADRLKVIERAAVLHDIGKIGIDLTLLNKKGILDADEIYNLREHSSIGMKILEPIEFLHDERVCIGQHHERFDGQGYPHRKGADSLLLESRILAIADSFDAMTSDRPYRKAMPTELAVRELRSHAGTQFDPFLVDKFVEALMETGLYRAPASYAEPHFFETCTESYTA